MLSLRDCLDYCDLTEDDVALIAQHAAIPEIAAAQMLCGMVQTPEGVLLLNDYLMELESQAHRAGNSEVAARAQRAQARFKAIHPSMD